MGLHAKNGQIHFPETDMDYIRFGTGKQVLVMLPGLGDGLRSTKGMALPTAALYRMYAKTHTVYMFSRKNHLPQGCTTRDMAYHLKQALDALHLQQVDLFGVSMGGMIAQHFAADYPERVRKLVLVVTCAQPNPVLTESVTEWMAQARANDHKALMDSNLRRIYSETYYRRNKWMIPFIGALTKPSSYERFLVQAEACLHHNAAAHLPGITAPTLVIGGVQDQALGGEASQQIAAAIADAQLYLYPEGCHGLYEEEKDFHHRVLAFLLG